MTSDSYPLDNPGPVPAVEIADAWRRELPDAPADAITVVTPIWRIAKLLADDRRRLLARLGVEPATLDLLSTIRRGGEPYELTTRDIAASTLVTAGAISQRVARAERDGLVERRRGVARTVWVRLTGSGHTLTDRVVGEILRRETELLSGLTGARQTQLADHLDVLYRDLTARLAD
ncbi:MarR family winged helix-turn-helix transcriptional regulator [Stackebrandtia soli]|uniref:MarR family winged helix-turn-helix transcriptional regulator n=1 Tax=Stackebrandtia soli TaxID=1892856 RepID=UPI0039E7960D